MNVIIHLISNSKSLYVNKVISFIYITIHVQVVGYLRLCNSTLLGITREISQQNGTGHSQKDIVCSSEDCQSVTVNYSTFNFDPQLNYIFIVDILNQLSNTKAKNESYFSEYNVVY